MSGTKSDFGKDLCKAWGVKARGYFDKNGQWYMPPLSYPAALCDPKGYVYFENEQGLKNCPSVKLGTTIHVEGGVSSLPTYKKMR